MMDPLTDEDLARLEALADAANPLPWRSERGYEQDDPGVYVATANGHLVGCMDQAPEPQDADFFVAACNALPALIAEVRRRRSGVG